ncbi:secretion protein HlyD family protein, partial [mine drainage metagenome]
GLIGDLHELFVRADVSKLDLSRVRVGARALISTDAFPGQSFPGKVVRVSGIMGKRHAISNDPADRRDDKTLAALIELDGHPPLPIGLRVDVRIATH